jgi:hypothetical protein
MKTKHLLLFLTVLGFSALIFFACSKSEGDGIAPTYSDEATNTGGNPNVGAQTST